MSGLGGQDTQGSLRGGGRGEQSLGPMVLGAGWASQPGETCRSAPTVATPRVSIPLSVLDPPHRHRIHRRKSFDASDTLALPRVRMGVGLPPVWPSPQLCPEAQRGPGLSQSHTVTLGSRTPVSGVQTGHSRHLCCSCSLMEVRLPTHPPSARELA